MGVEIQLTTSEMLLGAQAGALRQIENLRDDGSKPTHGLENNEKDWQLHIEGVLKEQAVAKHLNRYFSGKGKRGGVDVHDVDVRSTEHLDGCLIVHKSDPDDRFFYLVTGVNGTYKIHGGMYAREAKQEEFWRGKIPRPAFFVPQASLYLPKDDLGYISAKEV
jgi:hypothetical protein